MVWVLSAMARRAAEGSHQVKVSTGLLIDLRLAEREISPLRSDGCSFRTLVGPRQGRGRFALGLMAFAFVLAPFRPRNFCSFCLILKRW